MWPNHFVKLINLSKFICHVHINIKCDSHLTLEIGSQMNHVMQTIYGAIFGLHIDEDIRNNKSIKQNDPCRRISNVSGWYYVRIKLGVLKKVLFVGVILNEVISIQLLGKFQSHFLRLRSFSEHSDSLIIHKSLSCQSFPSISVKDWSSSIQSAGTRPLTLWKHSAASTFPQGGKSFCI